MKTDRQTHPYLQQAASYTRKHQASLGVFLASYGVFYLTSVLMSMWTLGDWGKDTTSYPPSMFTTLLPRSLINPIFLVTSFPALIIGVIMLCNYSLHGITSNSSVDKQRIAMLLAAFGFTYQVIGAWPLGNVVVFPWQWQKQILLNGMVFAWVLWLISFAVLAVGVFSLYKHSVIYHQKHPSDDEGALA